MANIINIAHHFEMDNNQHSKALRDVPQKSVMYYLLPFTCSILIGATIYCAQRWMQTPLSGFGATVQAEFAALSNRTQTNLFTGDRWGQLAICCAIGATLFALVTFMHYRQYRERFEQWQAGLVMSERELIRALRKNDSFPQTWWGSLVK